MVESLQAIVSSSNMQCGHNFSKMKQAKAIHSISGNGYQSFYPLFVMMSPKQYTHTHTLTRKTQFDISYE